MPPKDIRKIFAGDDPGKIIRAGAADLMARALRNTEKREREAAQHRYQTRPSLMVQVEQVQYQPPLWRMRTLQPVVEGGGQLEVYEADSKMLEAEMRIACRNELLKSGYFDEHPMDQQMNKARQWVTQMKIEREPTILLRDGQLDWTSGNRKTR